MLELLLSIFSFLFMMVLGAVEVNNESDDDNKADNPNKNISDKTDADEEIDDDQDEEYEDNNKEDEEISNELLNKKISDLLPNEIDTLFDNEAIDVEKLLEAIRKKSDETIDKFIITKQSKESEAEPIDKKESSQGNTEEDKLVKIDDAYIQSVLADKKDDAELLKPILEGIKGEQLTPKALQNYLNSQIYIKSIKHPLDDDWKLPEESKTEEYLKQAEEVKNKTLINKMKEHFPDFPNSLNEDELVDWEESLSRRDYLKYQKIFEDEKQKIDKEFDRYFYISNNWEKIAVDTLTADINLFKQKLNELEIKPEDLGIDLTLDENGYNKFIYDTFLLPNGKVNNKIVHFIADAVPVLEPKGLYREMLDLLWDEVVKTAKLKGKSEGYKEAVKDIPEPKGTHSSKSGLLDHEEEVSIFDDEDIDDAMLDKILKKTKQKIIKGV